MVSSQYEGRCDVLGSSKAVLNCVNNPCVQSGHPCGSRLYKAGTSYGCTSHG